MACSAILEMPLNVYTIDSSSNYVIKITFKVDIINSHTYLDGFLCGILMGVGFSHTEAQVTVKN